MSKPIKAPLSCPWCTQPISLLRGECGGVGEGICCGTVYAQDLLDPSRPTPDWEVETCAPPTLAQSRAIAAFWDNLSS